MSKPNKYPIPLFAALVTVAGYYYIALPDCLNRAQACFQSIAPAPYRYRVLAPLLESLITPDRNPAGIMWADLLIHTVCVGIAYAGLWAWLRRGVSANVAMVGVLLLAVVWMLSYQFYLRTIHTALELVCIILALLAVRSRLLLYAVLVIVASLNRETGFFLVLIWMVTYVTAWRTRDYWIRAGILWTVFAAVTIALRVALGYAEHVLGFAGTLAYNLSMNADMILLNAIILNVALSPVWYMLATGYRHAPADMKRLSLVGILYLGAIVVYAAWNETPRLILPLLPLVLPVILYPMDSQTGQVVVK